MVDTTFWVSSTQRNVSTSYLYGKYIDICSTVDANSTLIIVDA